MTVVKRIVCLANSRKPSGRCIAGREFRAGVAGPWIRPVSSRPTEEVNEVERQYEDGSDPRLLDVIDIPLLEPAPHACQTENWRIDRTRRWQRVERADWSELQAWIENPPTLWINGYSTYHGINDKIPLEPSDRLLRSLYLIRVAGVKLSVFAPSEDFGNPKRRVQAQFEYEGFPYHLRVTDPQIESKYLARENGSYSIGESCLTISLSEPFNDFRYKLVAAIIQHPTGPEK